METVVFFSGCPGRDVGACERPREAQPGLEAHHERVLRLLRRGQEPRVLVRPRAPRRSPPAGLPLRHSLQHQIMLDFSFLKTVQQITAHCGCSEQRVTMSTFLPYCHLVEVPDGLQQECQDCFVKKMSSILQFCSCCCRAARRPIL